MHLSNITHIWIWKHVNKPKICLDIKVECHSKNTEKFHKYPWYKLIFWLPNSPWVGRWAFRLPPKHVQSQQQDLIPFHRSVEVFAFRSIRAIYVKYPSFNSTLFKEKSTFHSLVHSQWLVLSVYFQQTVDKWGLLWVCVLLERFIALFSCNLTSVSDALTTNCAKVWGVW